MSPIINIFSSLILSIIALASLKNNLSFDILAGGETAGIPYAAFLAERLQKPMIYIRKKPKGFGKGCPKRISKKNKIPRKLYIAKF